MFFDLDYVIIKKEEEKEKATIKAHLFISMINTLRWQSNEKYVSAFFLLLFM
jgi:hypothetical protein